MGEPRLTRDRADPGVSCSQPITATQPVHGTPSTVGLYQLRMPRVCAGASNWGLSLGIETVAPRALRVARLTCRRLLGPDS